MKSSLTLLLLWSSLACFAQNWNLISPRHMPVRLLESDGNSLWVLGSELHQLDAQTLEPLQHLNQLEFPIDLDEVVGFQPPAGNGNLWLHTNKDVYGRIQGVWQSWTHFNNHTLSSYMLTKMLVDEAGTAWVSLGRPYSTDGKDYGVILRLDETGMDTVRLDLGYRALNGVQDMAMDIDGKVWVLADGKLWEVDNGHTQTFVLPSFIYDPQKVLTDQLGKLYVVHRQGISILWDGSWTHALYPGTSDVPELAVSRARLSGDGTLYIYREYDPTLTTFESGSWGTLDAPMMGREKRWGPNGRDNFDFRDLAVVNNQLFLGEEYLWKEDNGAFTRVPQNDSWLSSPPQCMVLNCEEEIWVGSRQGLDVYDFRSETAMHFDGSNSPMVGNRVYYIDWDSPRDALWAMTECGFNRYQNGQWTYLKFPGVTTCGLGEEIFVYDMKTDAVGDLWVGTSDGLWRWNDDHWCHFTEDNSPIPVEPNYSGPQDGGAHFARMGRSLGVSLGRFGWMIIDSVGTWKVANILVPDAAPPHFNGRGELVIMADGSLHEISKQTFRKIDYDFGFTDPYFTSYENLDADSWISMGYLYENQRLMTWGVTGLNFVRGDGIAARGEEEIWIASREGIWETTKDGIMAQALSKGTEIRKKGVRDDQNSWREVEVSCEDRLKPPKILAKLNLNLEFSPLDQMMVITIEEALQNPRMTLINAAGQTLYQNQWISIDGPIEISYAQLSAGQYWLRVEADEYPEGQIYRIGIIN
ncbi:MAG: hypothetical protein AAFP89_17070 [Bacteroidota bacterium]